MDGGEFSSADDEREPMLALDDDGIPLYRLDGRQSTLIPVIVSAVGVVGGLQFETAAGQRRPGSLRRHNSNASGCYNREVKFDETVL